MPQIALDKKSNLEYLEREVRHVVPTKVVGVSSRVSASKNLRVSFAGRPAQVLAAIRIKRNETKGTTQVNTTTLQKGCRIV